MDKPSKFNYITKYLLLLFITVGIIPNELLAQKINGMSLSGPQEPSFEATMFEAIKMSNANWVAFIPTAVLNRGTLLLQPDKDHNWWSETIDASIIGIQLAKKSGFKVFLKPHIVLSKSPSKLGTYQEIKPSKQSVRNTIFYNNSPLKDKTAGVEWRGELSAKNETDWQILEKSYEKYMLQLAQVASDLEVDLLSIGTELKQSTRQRPAFWRQLIQKIRVIYPGKLVYSANWDEYQQISFWQDLDYIGVDTYFPISRKATPTVKNTLKKWRSIQKKLAKFSTQQNKQILLTEFGYRNVSYSGKRPWLHDNGKAIVNNVAQRNLYEAFFQAFWDKNWVAGGFAWQWFCVPKPKENTSFSMRDKPALSVLKDWYSKN